MEKSMPRARTSQGPERTSTSEERRRRLATEDGKRRLQTLTEIPSTIDEDALRLAYQRCLHQDHEDCLSFQAQAGTGLQHVRLFKNVKPCVESIDRAVLAHTGELLNLPLLRHLQALLHKHTEQTEQLVGSGREEMREDRINMQSDVQIRIDVTLSKDGEVGIKVNNMCAITLPLKDKSHAQLIYNGSTKTLTLATSEAFPAGSGAVPTQEPTITISTGYDTLHSGSKEQEIGMGMGMGAVMTTKTKTKTKTEAKAETETETKTKTKTGTEKERETEMEMETEIIGKQTGQPPKTPSFPTHTGSVSFDLRTGESQKLPQEQKQAFDWAYKLWREKQVPQTQNFALLHLLAKAAYIDDSTGYSELETEIFSTLEHEVYSKDLSYTHKDATKRAMKRLWDLYARLFPKVQRTLPLTSKLLQHVTRGMLIAADKAVRGSKEYVIAVQERLKQQQQWQEERKSLQEQIRTLEQEAVLLRYGQEVANKIASTRADEESQITRQLERDLSSIAGNFKAEHQGLYAQLKAELSKTANTIQEQTHAQSLVVKQLVESTTSSIVETLRDTNRHQARTAPALPSTSFGIQVKLDKRHSQLTEYYNEAHAYWDYLGYIESLLYPFQRDLKTYSHLQLLYTLDAYFVYITTKQLIHRATWVWQDTGLDISKCNAFDTLYNELRYTLVGFMEAKARAESTDVHKEYVSFLSGLKSLYRQQDDPIASLVLKLLDMPNLQTSTCRSSILRNYLIVVLVKAYVLFYSLWYFAVFPLLL